MQRRQVMALYRAKLDVCKKMGYKSGDWDNKYIFDYVDIKRKDVMRMIRRDTIGKVVWNNVRYTYKVNKREHEKEYLEDAIDYGFLMLNWINVLKVVYSNNKPLLLKF